MASMFGGNDTKAGFLYSIHVSDLSYQSTKLPAKPRAKCGC